MDTLIIEHLACLEVNRVILQEPYHLVSEVQFNDKSPSFDGEIIVYNTNELKKENIEGTVRVQIKGTTVYKNIKGNGRITHSLDKRDLEVYKKIGEGVLYFVVTINKKTKRMQIFYNSLNPLNIERLLGIIEQKKQDSVSIDFKSLKDSDLENICRMHMKSVKKQPSNYIELSKTRDYQQYKIEYNIIPNESRDFSFFDNIGYVYGIEGNIEFPVEAVITETINIVGEDYVILGEEKVSIKYNITESLDEITLSIEDTLTFVFSKKKKKGKLNMSRLQTITSYLNSLKVLKFILENNKFPVKVYNIIATINEKERFENIEEELLRYESLLNICERLGISGDYRFNEKEDLDSLFNSIYNVFYKKNYRAIISEVDIENVSVLRLKMSEYITLLLYKDSKDDLYYNLFDKDIFKKMAAYIPKNPGEFNPNTDDYFKVSIYCQYEIQDLLTLVNFKYDMYEKSFESDFHDKSIDSNIQISLDLITTYDKTRDYKYLKLADKLLNGLMESESENSVIKLNLLQIKKRTSKPLENSEEEFLYDVLEKNNNKQMKFVANVILGLKTPAVRLLSGMDDNEKSEIYKWPIYNLFLEI